MINENDFDQAIAIVGLEFPTGFPRAEEYRLRHYLKMGLSTTEIIGIIKAEIKFPILYSGSCDGLGCGNKAPNCFCENYLIMQNMYQVEFDKPWNSDTLQCAEYEEAWREKTKED